MILKSPYAFLIKYFRVINLAITFLLVYIAIRLARITNFFDTYVKNGYSLTNSSGLAKIYTPLSLYVMLFVVIALLIALVVLMIYKKKPFRLYLSIIIYYSLIFISMFYITSVLNSFEETLLASTTSRGIRDILMIVYIPQYIFIIFMILRTIGFDLKKFNFTNDIKDLNLSRQDAEEIEINIDFQGYKAKRVAHRTFREAIYYIRENKFMFICIFSIIGILLFHFVRVNYLVSYDKNVGMNKRFTYNNFEISFEDAIITNLDYAGNKLDSYYVVIKTYVKNKSNKSLDLDTNALKMQIGDELIKPDLVYSKNFIDFAPTLSSKMIGSNMEKRFALIYKIDSKQVSKTKTIVIHNGTTTKKDRVIDKHIYVKLKTSTINNVEIVGNYNLNDTLNFKDTFIGDTSFKPTSYTVAESYKYKYDVCDDNNECKTYDDMITVGLSSRGERHVLLVVDTVFSQDKNTLYAQSFNSLNGFSNNFICVQYRINGEVYKNKEINVTATYSNRFVVFEVPASVEHADVIQLIITIRNKEYIVNLRK